MSEINERRIKRKVDRFNNGKKAEVRDRVKHGTDGLMSANK